MYNTILFLQKQEEFSEYLKATFVIPNLIQAALKQTFLQSLKTEKIKKLEQKCIYNMHAKGNIINYLKSGFLQNPVWAMGHSHTNKRQYFPNDYGK